MVFSKLIRTFADSFEKTNIIESARVAKLVDALDLGSSAARRGGSTPSTCTTIQRMEHKVPFFVSLKYILT